MFYSLHVYYINVVHYSTTVQIIWYIYYDVFSILYYIILYNIHIGTI